MRKRDDQISENAEKHAEIICRECFIILDLADLLKSENSSHQRYPGSRGHGFKIATPSYSSWNSGLNLLIGETNVGIPVLVHCSCFAVLLTLSIFPLFSTNHLVQMMEIKSVKIKVLLTVLWSIKCGWMSTSHSALDRFFQTIPLFFLRYFHFLCTTSFWLSCPPREAAWSWEERCVQPEQICTGEEGKPRPSLLVHRQFQKCLRQSAQKTFCPLRSKPLWLLLFCCWHLVF